MRLTLHPRLSRIVRALPQGGPLAWLEILLLVALAVQLARLVWTLATPVGPVGEWRPPQSPMMSVEARTALLARVDPFFRGNAGAQGPAAVTSLSLKLYGIRLNEASGGGSAIIATPDGVQSSIAVGQEVVAGVTLKAVAIDHVVLSRGGVDETLYIDQSVSAPTAAPGPVAATPPIGTLPAAPIPATAATAQPNQTTAGAAPVAPPPGAPQSPAQFNAPPAQQNPPRN